MVNMHLGIRKKKGSSYAALRCRNDSSFLLGKVLAQKMQRILSCASTLYSRVSNNRTNQRSHSIHMLSIQIDTKNLELIIYHQFNNIKLSFFASHIKSKVPNNRTCMIRNFFQKITDKKFSFFSCAAKIISIDFLEKWVPVWSKTIK